MKANRKFTDDQLAVSDVVGSILLVAITVILAAALGTLIFTVAKPIETIQADLAARAEPGANGWGTGDEAISISHLGGEPILANSSRIQITIGGVVTTLKGSAQLGGAFLDGKLTIGETWTRTQTIQPNLQISVLLVADTRGGGSQLLATLSTATDCSGDASPPIVSAWQQTPGDVSTATSAGQSVTVKATLTDLCTGVNAAVPLYLYYRVSPQQSAFTKIATPMTQSPALTYTATIPTQNWAVLGSQFLEYYISPMTDLLGNAGPSPTQQDPIDDLSQYTYLTSALVQGGFGTVTNFAAATSANDAGVSAVLTEKGTAGASTTTSFSGTSATGVGIATGSAYANAIASDDVYAVLDSTGDRVDVSGFSIPGTPASISSVVIGFEGKNSGSGGTSPTVTMSYSAGSCSGFAPPFIIASSTDSQPTQTHTVTGCSWDVAKINALTISVSATAIVNRNAMIDQIYARITYVPTYYNMTIDLQFTNVPAGTGTRELQIGYNAPVERFQFKPWDGTTFTTGGTLNQALPTVATYLLSNSEYRSGQPVIRIVDLTPTNTNAEVLNLDFVRIRST